MITLAACASLNAMSQKTGKQSPYRTDAEKMISTIYSEMKKENKEAKFYEIMKAYNILVNFK